MATDTKFTPGPWQVRPVSAGFIGGEMAFSHLEVATIWPGNGPDATICEIRSRSGFKFGSPGIDIRPCDEANAHLIAAAPDLYAALDEALAALYGAISVCGAIGNLTHARDLAESTLKKARGEA